MSRTDVHYSRGPSIVVLAVSLILELGGRLDLESLLGRWFVDRRLRLWTRGMYMGCLVQRWRRGHAVVIFNGEGSVSFGVQSGGGHW